MGRQWKNKYILALTAAMIWILAFAMTIEVYGAEARVVSTIVSDGYIYIYLRGVSKLEDGTMVQIGTRACPKEDVAVGTMDSMEISMRTILLVDNSKSIPQNNHQDIQVLLKSIVSGAMEREQIKIGIVSDQLTYLCEFTSDKETLNNVIEGITYNNQDTYLSDILYDVIAGLEKEDTGILTRIVIFADGADDKAIGYTNEEVRRLIEKGTYPVYAVGFPKKNNSEQLETMFSFARASSSEYYLVDGSVAREEIADGLLRDQKDLCIRIRPDESLFDGGSKNIRLKLKTPEGETELAAVAHMPFGDSRELETETEEIPAESQTEAETTKETLPSLAPAKNEAETIEETGKKGNPLWLYIALSVSAIIFAAVLVFVILQNKRKGKENRAAEETDKRESKKEWEDCAEAMGTYGSEDETRLSCEENPDDAKPLWEKKQYCVTLWNIDKPDISYTVPIENVVRIGRVGNDINITDDRTVSKQHCELILRGEILYIKDLGSKNGTKHQNIRIDGERSVASGDIIKIGMSRYRVELIKKQ